MRLDGRKGDTGWDVYDAEKCCEVDWILWIDDETCEYFQLHHDPFVLIDDEPAGRVVKVRKVSIYIDLKLVIINPVEDSERDAVAKYIVASGPIVAVKEVYEDGVRIRDRVVGFSCGCGMRTFVGSRHYQTCPKRDEGRTGEVEIRLWRSAP